MRLARILVDLDRDETAVEAGILLLCPHGAIFRRESGVVEDLSEHFGPPSLIDAELAALSGETWPYEVDAPVAHNIASAFEAFVSAVPRPILLDVADYVMYASTARDSLQRRIEYCPRSPLTAYTPRRAARLRHLWLAAIVALERRAGRLPEIVRGQRTNEYVEYSYSSAAGSSSLGMHLEFAEPLRPYLRLESEWYERDGREMGPTMRFPMEWQHGDEIVLKTDNWSPACGIARRLAREATL